MIIDDLLNRILDECYAKTSDSVIYALLYGIAQSLEDLDAEIDQLKADAYLSTSTKLYQNFGALLDFPQGANISDEEYRNQLKGLVNGAVLGATVRGLSEVFTGLGLIPTIYENFRYSQLDEDLFKFSVNLLSFGNYTQESLNRLLKRFKPVHTEGEVSQGGIILEGTDRSYSASASSEYNFSYSDGLDSLTYIDTDNTNAFWNSSQTLFQLEEGEI